MSIERFPTERRREQIAEAALSFIANRGVESLSMAVLARRLGIVPSAIYRHFDSKDKVLDAVVDLLHQRLLGNVQAVRQQAGEPLEQLKRLLALHVRLILDYQALPRLVFSGDIYAGRPERKTKIYETIKTYLGEVAEIIREGQKQGAIDPGLDADMLSVVFLGLIQPAAILWYLSDGKFDAGKQVERSWPFFCEAVKVSKDAAGLPDERRRT